MLDHQKRVVEERDALRDKMSRLDMFIVGDRFEKLDFVEKHLLNIQRRAMGDYCQILEARIKLFQVPGSSDG